MTLEDSLDPIQRDTAGPSAPLSTSSGLSRRGFLMGAGVALAGASTLGRGLGWAQAATKTPIAPGVAVGVAAGFDQLARKGATDVLSTFAAVSELHPSTLRFPLRWDQVEAKRGCLDWSPYARVHQQLVLDGWDGLPVVVGCPDWLRAGDAAIAANGLRYPVSDAALEAFGQFIVAAAKEFNSYGGYVHEVEVWTEPNNPAGAYIADPDCLGAMIDAATAGVAAGDFQDGTSIGVISGGLDTSGDARTWLRYLRGFAGSQSEFALGLHVLAEQPSRARADVRRICDQVAAASQREIWVTAAGVKAGSGSKAETANGLADVVDTLAGRSACRGIIVSGLYPNPEASELALNERTSQVGALLNSTGARTPAFGAISSAWS